MSTVLHGIGSERCGECWVRLTEHERGSGEARAVEVPARHRGSLRGLLGRFRTTPATPEPSKDTAGRLCTLCFENVMSVHARRTKALRDEAIAGTHEVYIRYEDPKPPKSPGLIARGMCE